MRDPRAVPNLLSPVASCMICNPSDQAQELWRSNAVVYLFVMLCECKVIPSAARSRPNRQRCRALFNLALNWVQPTRQVMCQESRAFMTSKKRCDLNKEKRRDKFSAISLITTAQLDAAETPPAPPELRNTIHGPPSPCILRKCQDVVAMRSPSVPRSSLLPRSRKSHASVNLDIISRRGRWNTELRLISILMCRHQLCSRSFDCRI